MTPAKATSSSDTSASQKVVVIGAGIVGVNVGLALLGKGYDVTILDRGEPGMGASFGNAGGIAVSAALPGLAQRALSKVGLNFDLTSGYRATVSSLALAGLGGYALYSIAGVSSQTAGLFTVAAMVPAALGALSNLGLPVPSIHASGGILATGTSGLFGLLGNAPSVIDEPMFGMTHGYHDGMHAGMHAGAHGEMFGLGGKDINLF